MIDYSNFTCQTAVNCIMNSHLPLGNLRTWMVLVGVGCFILMIGLVAYHQKKFNREGVFNINKYGIHDLNEEVKE